MQIQNPVVLRDPRGRFIFVQCCIDDKPYTLASIYVPNSGQLDFLKSTFALLQSFQVGDLLVGGDFNLVPDVSLDKSGGRKKCIRRQAQRSGCSLFQSLLKSFNLIDIWRQLYPLARQYTFFFSFPSDPFQDRLAARVPDSLSDL